MSINFPDSPTLNQTYTSGSTTWIWNGSAWNFVAGAAPSGLQGAQGVQGPLGSQGLIGVQGGLGAQGVQGISGAFSAQGIQGVQGVQGPEGQVDLVASTPPTPTYAGQIWFDTASMKTFVWYDNYWIEVASSSYEIQYIRETISQGTSSLAAGASQNVTFSGYKSYSLISINTSAAAWVVLYNSPSARTADAGRQINVDPIPGNGVIAEVITSGAQTYTFSPFVFGGSAENPPTTNIYARITNLGTTNQSIIVTLTLLRLEV